MMMMMMMMIIIIIIIIIINLPLASTCYIKPENETGAKRESKKDKENWRKKPDSKKERKVRLLTHTRSDSRHTDSRHEGYDVEASWIARKWPERMCVLEVQVFKR